MTRERNSFLTFVAILILILILAVAFAARAQMADVSQRSTAHGVVIAQQDALTFS